MRRAWDFNVARESELKHFDYAESGDKWVIRHWNGDNTLSHLSPEMDHETLWSVIDSLRRVGHRYQKHN